ncbi:kinase-like domain-containing protein [Rhexocercosporidium sp. MPI-PUGE-AT-0058]|nr:kinase-like domain-containing protein [Rhexocercosporidium sp. MPI-PUGE-AT-0058]
MASTIRTVDSRYDDKDPLSLLGLMNAFFPSWEKVEVKRMTGGVNNTLFKIRKADSESDSDYQDLDAEAALIRVYGGSSGILVDRERELECHVLLQEHGLAPRIIGRFQNGYAYGFVPGKVCSPVELALEPVWRGIAERSIGRVACHFTAAEPASLNIWSVLNKWITALPTSTEEQAAKRNDLIAEAGILVALFCKNKVQDMPELVFAHCDLLAGNIVIKPRDDNDGSLRTVEQVDFIDFEYAMSAPATFDIACHFSEWVGFECDYTLLPSQSVRRQFLLQYMSTYNELCGPDRKIRDVDELCAEVDRFRGVPGFFWGIGALIQAQVSKMDFDFTKYADLRITEYMDWKAEMNGSREKSGKEKPVREQQWAKKD